MTRQIYIALISSVLIFVSPVLLALPPGMEEPGTTESYALCAAVAEVHILFLERDLPLYGKNSDENEILKKHRRHHRKELKRFEKKLLKTTSETEVAELVSAERFEVLQALSTQQVEDDFVATDALRKSKLDEWYTEFCDSKR